MRERWVGLSLPVAQRSTAPRTYLTSGVLSGPRSFLGAVRALVTGRLERETGFRVEAKAAIELLETASPEAAAWWRENAAHEMRRGRYFLFSHDVGHLSVGDTGA